ncbi:MAG TPA: NUDIX domain-containing protein [Saprospiraceae bacterium]|nr:NUDIX domain-containing protein [Saprospiraceae bacterium]HNG88735.1 NUDIX domain-containing protein [Saprospiraceae bacterium]
MRHTYSRAAFERLYQDIAQKLAERERPIRILNNKGGQDTNQLGVKWLFSQSRSELDNAAAIIYDFLVLNKVIEEGVNLNFGKLLYSKRNALEQDPNLDEVVIQGKEYNEGLIRFAGYESWEALEATIRGAKQPATPSSAVSQRFDPILSDSSSWVYYIGTYYSFRSYRVNKYVLAIKYTDTPAQPMECWEWGFHTTERLISPQAPLPAKVNSVRFTGEAKVCGRHLYINLYAAVSDNRSAMEMHLVGLCDELGGESLKYQECIPGALQTVSLDMYTISLETYLLRCTEAEAMRLMESPTAYFENRIIAESLAKNPPREKSLQLYLMLQRRNFRSKFKPNVSDLDNLEYRGNSVSKYTERMPGEYRIWNFGLRRGVVIQSKLTVSTDVPYRTFFYPYLSEQLRRDNPGLEEQPAVLLISNEIRRDQLCFSTFVKRGLTLVNYAIFDIRNLRDDNWVEGMFVTTGYDHKGIVGGYAVMCKVKPGETCEPCYMEREVAEEYARSLGLTQMHDGLRSLWKRKLWKQKSNTAFGCYAIIKHPQHGVLMVRKDTGPYAGRFELPGGKLQHGETPEEGLKRRVSEETGVEIQGCSLWSNESANFTWHRPDTIEEQLHHIGALYVADIRDVSVGPLHRQAVWVKRNEYAADAFSEFALKAIERWG